MHSDHNAASVRYFRQGTLQALADSVASQSFLCDGMGCGSPGQMLHSRWIVQIHLKDNFGRQIPSRKACCREAYRPTLEFVTVAQIRTVDFPPVPIEGA